VLPDGHRLAEAEGPRLAELAGETWIAGCERCRGHLVHACAAAGFTPRIAFATDDYVAVQQLVAAGLGIALLPELVTRVVRLPGVATLPLDGGPSRRITVLAAAGERHPPAVAVLLRMLQAAAAELRQPSPRVR
jgi:DNA-binding transcriptional LysR family regulator